MNWGSWEKFFAMGGYALYVWSSYLVALALLIAELAFLALRKRNAVGRIRAGGTAGRADR
ncbi:MAG TPA: heme exporter protein CcmD [Burkholderiales bacterium]|jgi:heme exporter protein D